MLRIYYTDQDNVINIRVNYPETSNENMPFA